MPVRLRPADREDAAFLLDLEEACTKGYAEALWGVWRPTGTPETLDVADFEIVEHDGRPAGCIAVVWRPDHLLVRKLYVAPTHQGQGIGAVVLRSKTEAAAALGLPTRLTVLTTNPADRFYSREGFVLESETAERRTFVKSLPG